MKRMTKLLALLTLTVFATASCATESAVTTSETPTETAEEGAWSDDELTTNVATKLLAEGAAPAGAVNVETNDGFVRLTGTVDTIERKERSEMIAGDTRGVRGVVNLIKVDAPNVPDDQLTARVQSALDEDPATRTYDVEPIANNGSVVITGTVEAPAEAELVTTVAQSVKGVERVANNVNIKSGEVPSQEELQKTVRQRLAWDARIDSSGIIVVVDENRVILDGHAPSVYQRSLASSLAWIEGVTEVDASQLNVDWSSPEPTPAVETRSDDAIEAAVSEALLFDPRVKSFDTNVVVRQGEVTLTGKVDNVKAKVAAERTASTVRGVSEVNNMIVVDTVVTPKDELVDADQAPDGIAY